MMVDTEEENESAVDHLWMSNSTSASATSENSGIENSSGSLVENKQQDSGNCMSQSSLLSIEFNNDNNYDDNLHDKIDDSTTTSDTLLCPETKVGTIVVEDIAISGSITNNNDIENDFNEPTNDLLLISEDWEEEGATTSKVSSTSVISKAKTAAATTSTAAVVAAATKISSIGGSLAFRYMQRAATTTTTTTEDNNNSATIGIDSATDTNKASTTASAAAASPAGALFSRFRGGARAAPPVTTSTNATTSLTPTTPLFVFTEKDTDAHKKSSHWDGWSSSQKYFGLEVQHHFSSLILEKKKTVDIRRYELPKELWNKPLVLLETPSASSTSKIPNVLSSDTEIDHKFQIKARGWFCIRECIKYTSHTEFTHDESRHCVGSDSEYGWLKGYTKELYGWVIDTVRTGDTQIQINHMIRRMRSLYELGVPPPTAISTLSTNNRDVVVAASNNVDEQQQHDDICAATLCFDVCTSEKTTSMADSSSSSLSLEASLATDLKSMNNAIIDETCIEATSMTHDEIELQNDNPTNDNSTSAIVPSASVDTPTVTDVMESNNKCDAQFISLDKVTYIQDDDNVATTATIMVPLSNLSTLNNIHPNDELEKADDTIATLIQTNSVLSTKYQELRAQMDGQTHVLGELQQSLQKQLEQCGELSHEKRNLKSALEKEKSERKDLVKQNATLNEERQVLLSEKLRMGNEIHKLKEKVMELETRESTTIARLNESKKQEAIKSREVIALQSELTSIKPKLVEFTLEKDMFDKERLKCMERTKKAEDELKKELELNEERKKKMKEYVTTKAEELRNVKDTGAALTRELDEMRSQYKLNRDQLQDAIASLTSKDADLRILKTEFERIKQDSEMLHRMGNSLESELSKSSREASEHKHKRLEAKQELMSMLRKLEMEQKACKELKEKIKFTFTPKAISQQKLLNESVESLESALLRLSRRLGKPLPQRTTTESETADAIEGGDDQEEGRPILIGSGSAKARSGVNKSIGNGATSGKLSEWDTSRLVHILEDETQHVSQSIMTLTSSVDRIYMLLEDSTGERTCVSSFADILSGGRQPSTSTSATIEPVRGAVNNRWPRSFR